MDDLVNLDIVEWTWGDRKKPHITIYLNNTRIYGVNPLSGKTTTIRVNPKLVIAALGA